MVEEDIHSIQFSEWWRRIFTVFNEVRSGGDMHSIQYSEWWSWMCTVFSIESGRRERGGGFTVFSVVSGGGWY